jgi:protein-tyrosine phosphatase
MGEPRLRKVFMSSARVEVSPAKPADIDTVLGILDEAAEWVIANRLPSAWKPGEFSRQTFLDQIAQGEVYLARVDGQPVGTFVLQWSDTFWWGERPPDACYFHKFAVRPSLAGRGIGLEMLRWAEERTRSAGKKFLRLNCIAADQKIRDYYERAGFIHRGDVMGPKALASLYEKRL